jgi:type I pantothenate kinase
VVIVEGVNVLQTGPVLSVSDFFDFSIYVDADEADVMQWYVERFQALRSTMSRGGQGFYGRFTELSEMDTVEVATWVWREINGRNLVENILPTRERADLILRKGPDHRVAEVRLRRI